MNETLNQILNQEIKKHIGRFPTIQEFQKLAEYIAFYQDDDTDLEGLTGIIANFIEEKMAECENCGQWHLKEDMVNPYGDSEYYCDDQCQELHQEKFYDMHAEARAEYTASNR